MPVVVVAVFFPVEPQPIKNRTVATAGSANVQRKRDLRMLMAKAKPRAASTISGRSSLGAMGIANGATVACAVEVTVTCAVAPLAPGVTVPGETVHVDPLGAPEQLSVTA